MNAKQITGGPDVAQLANQDLPTAAFPGGQGLKFRVFFSPEVHARMAAHAKEDLSVEVCGVLVGQWSKDANGPFVVISEAIRGEAAASKFAEVTFTHETWAKINQEMDTKFTHLAIVGWYHTHPDFGVFLSDRDLFIQEHFFSGPGQIAYVLDPIRKTEGVFVWSNGKPTLTPHYWVGDRLQVTDTSLPGPKGGASAASGNGPAGPAAAESRPSLVSAETLNWIFHGLAFLALFLFGIVVASWLYQYDRGRAEQNAISDAALFLGVKPGLRELLDRCLEDVRQGTAQAEALAKEQAQASEPSDAQKEKWNTIREDLSRTQARLRRAQALYCMTPAETDQMIRALAEILTPKEGLTQAEHLDRVRELQKLLLQSLLQDPQRSEKSSEKPKDEGKEKEPGKKQSGS